MAIVKLQPDQAPPIVVNTPETIQEPSKSIFTSLVPESTVTSLLKYIEGYPWSINYYGQLLNVNNTLENFDPTTPNLTQPYYCVSDMVIQVSSPLNSNYDATTGVTTVNGSAVMPYKITPNVGDVFIAKVDNGEDAIFIISTVSRKTYRKDTLYEVSYNLYAYTSANPSFVPTLGQRVQDTYFFNKDTDFFNRDVLIKPSVKEAIDRLNTFLRESQDHYFSTFAQKETGGITVPGMGNAVYDPLLINFISKIVDYKALVDIPFYKFSHSNNRYIEQKSILDLLLTRSISLLPTINKTYNFVPTASVPNKARLGTLWHTGIDYVLFPMNPNKDMEITDMTITATDMPVIPQLKNSKNYSMPIPPITIQTSNNNGIFNKPLLHELFVNDSYIVSDNFYTYLNDNTTYANISYIEFLIYKFINKEAIAKEDLAVCVEKYSDWSLMHQLYILPLLWHIVANT